MDFKKLLPLIGIAIFLYIIFSIGLDKIIQALLSADLLLLFFAFLFAIPITLIQASKWHLLVKSQGMKISFLELYKIYFIGLFYGAITPGKLGSFIRISYLSKKTSNPLSVCASSVFLDRIADMLSIFLLSFFGFFVFLKIFTDIVPPVIIFSISFFAALFFFSTKTKIVLGFVLTKLIGGELKEKSGEIVKNFYSNFPSRKQRAVLLASSVFCWLLVFAQSYVIARAFGISIPAYEFVGFLSLSSIVGLLPITVNGHGTTEASLIFFFSFFGVAAQSVFVFSIVNSLLLTYFTAFAGFLFSLKNR